MIYAAAKCRRLLMVLLVVLMAEIEVQAQSNDVNGDRLAAEMRSGVENVTDRLASELKRRASYCIVDDHGIDFIDGKPSFPTYKQVGVIVMKTDWNRAFNYSNSDFLTSCVTTTRAEIRFYLGGFSNEMGLQSNKNCNLTSWVAGCEPGWACSTGPVEGSDLEYVQGIPARTSECKSCSGFLLSFALICAFNLEACPLGSYCPLATFNETTDLCEPYNYQLPAGRNHTCGGANIWANVDRSREVFCPAGSYCPTTIEKRPCDSGHYCLTGSTSEQRKYLIKLIEASTVLVVVNDQIGTFIIRRRARNRERAVKSLQQKERVLARWRFAKDAALEHAGKLQANLSRRFSQRNNQEIFNKLHDLDIQEDTSQSSTHNHAGNSSNLHSSSTGLEKSKHSAKLHMPKDGPQNHDSLGLEIEGKNSKEKVKEKHIRRDSQIFKYAYAQIEKERTQERQFDNLTFSGVISEATGDEVMKRPLIEVGFKDLTLTLKGKQRCLLKCLTGKIMPGHITAVMGPSGAGKTTFMSALAGKATGFKRSGLVLINGKPESIHSYKKIVGFVPQDDIVHGNLTVEENLRFSAWCRLSTKLPRADKVLIVERVLMNLGLQEVRDSLVGTVEKRGISGGQRKRVNVGLEMVIEPSLLFLDEPTSGLDSSSSRLLLKALKHEALAGVNVCMVVHQPSYALFKMFDDLILLANGGLMVYHGSVRKVEEYFEGLGIVVPERVNPPDHYIDILEGLVGPSQSSNFSYKDLPLRWMLHNGYSIPEDMQSRAAELENSQGIGSESSGSVGELQSFTTEIWQDLRCNVEQRRDHIRHFFLRKKDLANRRTPGVILQYKYFLGRVTKQRLREAKLQATDYLILLLAGACLGAITKISDSDFGAAGYTYTIIAISLLCQIAALRTFSMDKLQYLRESASGISSLAHFLAKDTVDHFNTAIKPVFSVLLPVCLTLISSQSLKNESLKGIAKVCYPKWALEALVIANAKRYYGVWLINRCGVLDKLGYNLHAWRDCILILIAYGAVSRVIAFISLLIIRKK
ncbi:ABC transporter G family member 24 [Bienertia sinuspersici]